MGPRGGEMGIPEVAGSNPNDGCSERGRGGRLVCTGAVSIREVGVLLLALCPCNYVDCAVAA